MKLELIKHNTLNSDCIRSNFVSGDAEISSRGLFLKEMHDHRGLSHTEDEILRGLLDEFSRCFVHDRSIVYAILRHDFPKEYTAKRDEFRKAGFEFVAEKEAASKLGLRYRLLYWRVDPTAIYVANARWEDLSRWYRESDAWRSACFMFLVSPVAIEGWVNELARLSMGTVDKGFLRNSRLIFFNYFDHGMEAVGLAEPNEPPEPLERVAKLLSQRFNLPLDIRDKRAKAKYRIPRDSTLPSR